MRSMGLVFTCSFRAPAFSSGWEWHSSFGETATSQLQGKATCIATLHDAFYLWRAASRRLSTSLWRGNARHLPQDVIPDGVGYQKKYYFNPGSTGFRVWDTEHGKVGVGTCWEQCVSEAAR